jgi:S-DNA-T family DNA segregation ATPase FtsK/SpoIIIE
MTEPSLISRQRTLLRELALLVSRRAAAAPELERTHRSRKSAEALEFEEAYQSTIVRFAADKEAADGQAQESRETSTAHFVAERDTAEQEHADAVRKYTARYQRDKEAAKTAFQEAKWGIEAELEGNKQAARDKLREDEKRVADKVERLQTIRQQARDLLTRWGRSPDALETGLVYPPVGEGRPRLRNLQECLAVAEQGLYKLQTMIIPGLLRGGRLVFLFIVVWLSLVYPLGELARLVIAKEAQLAGVLLLGLAASTIATLIAGFSIGGTLITLARRRIRKAYRPLCQAVLDADVSREHILTTFRTRCRRQVREHKRRHNNELHQVFDKYRKQRKEIKRRFRAEEQQAAQRYQQRREANDKRVAEEQREAEERHQRRREEIQRRFDEESKYLQTAHQRHLEEIKTWYERERQTLVKSWHQGLAHLQKQAAAIAGEVAALFPGWNDPRWQQWQPNKEVPPAFRFGSFRVSLEQFAHGVPDDEQLKPVTPVDFTLPALAPLAVERSLLLEAGEKGRDEAVDTLQMLMFRLLTSIPPAKVRFTILDPVGLGQNFAAFMHLADYDESLVASRIWTETAHIEQRLADLTAHMENVIQKYLRNQYQSITEYNAQAGEVAEPFRVLVVANFPVNFSAEAIRRLVSIVQSGPRCGVTALISVDTRQPLPPGFDLADLEAHGVTLVHDGGAGRTSPNDAPNGGFVWKDEDFGRFPLLIDPPPEAGLCNRLLHEVGAKAREAARVEVPFEFIAPPPDQWWTGDSRTGLTVPLGRAGATKRQHMNLGRGTAQHVLVAGKTGSGKSTLLHVLITNLALLYSPDEVELYLIDFKKGVEFKAYAALGLPHARVIAIESEREFGLSVLQRLDAELKVRGDRFRDTGAQDLNAFRTAHPGVHMPRILLLVDEFQEFFTEDDRISQDAAQLLDRLVRQGRAFGLHVLLGSQTLGGAYTLARSTIDQMAVRIALQCSEADAQLILSDDNSAARLLSRPGEAIYNDANGLVEGNDPFQIVWLGDDRREAYLKRIRELEQRRRAMSNGHGLPPPVVFEGNADADPVKNHLLHGLLEARDWPAPGRSSLAWLGEAIAIKDPTAATFRRQSSSNLLIVGQQDEAALGILSVALVGLAAQFAPDSGARFYVVDGSPADAPHAGFLGRLPAILPHPLRVLTWREVPAVMAELSAELERRQKATDEEAPPVYLLLYGLQRLRDLRKQEDDFSFMRKADEAPSPAQQFATLLREGSGHGMHTVVWCDTLNNLQRSLDRQTLREFEMRVLFQMSVSDSSNLIDTPAAGKLGVHRALYYSEEEGRLEKFRPYGVPTAEWLEWVRQQLHGRTSAAVQGPSLV